MSSSGAEEYAWQVAYGVGKCALDRITADTAHELERRTACRWCRCGRASCAPSASTSGAADGPAPRQPRPRARRSRPGSWAAAVVALATDPDVARWSGQAVSARDLADEYGFTDVDGSLPAGPLRHRTTEPSSCGLGTLCAESRTRWSGDDAGVARAASSSSVRPSSRRTSSVCWPTVGAGARYELSKRVGAHPGARVADQPGDRVLEPLGEPALGELRAARPGSSGPTPARPARPRRAARRRCRRGRGPANHSASAASMSSWRGPPAGAGRERRVGRPLGLAEHRRPARATRRRS